MSNLTANEISTLLQDKKFAKKVINEALASPDVMEELADDIADELSDLLEDDEQLQREFMSQALAGDGFKKQVIEKLMAELNDD